MNSIRQLTFDTYVRFNALKNKIKAFEEKSKKIKGKYNVIINSEIPKRKDVEEYVILLHELFADATMSDMLIRAKTVLEGLSR